MKKILLAFLTIFLLFFFFNQKGPSFKDGPLPQEDQPEAGQPMAEPSIIDKLDTITYNHQIYPFAYYQVNNSENLKLFLNLPQAESSIDIIKKNNCIFLTNGGFYDKNNQPIGWFVLDGKELSKEITSRLFNGFLQLSNKKVFITTLPLPNVDFGLQSGPLLIQDQKTLGLKIINDEGRRRIIAAITTQNHLIFIAIISKESEFNGPLLAETPQVLEKIGQKINQEFESAINLDGGSASVFFTPETFIEEFSPIGSYFCL